ncbi:rifin [Plasmodium falciparum Dd2]|uniref:Rifin n=1 Tax=Plasmodium falciparum (isolate Dd2) TaxID=57267 RepID=A0A0L7M1G5_PLAF4|nr:rifin [Plasmodium falciparum Dd2]
MKFNYTNILLFALPLNILLILCHVYNQRNHKRTTPNHTQTTRSLCECKLYSPANYDSDPQMRKVMENFNKQTQQRLRDYDDRMIEKRMQCKDKCDKEIQNIILKDKLEKELMDKFATLDTDIQSDAIPTCVCEKSLADKMEKGCLRCVGVFGGGVAPSVGLLGGIGEAAISVLKPLALKAATEEAIAEATAAAIEAGMKAVSLKIEKLGIIFTAREGFVDLSSIVSKSTFNNGRVLVESAKKLIGKLCMSDNGGYTSFYNTTIYSGRDEYYLGNIAKVGATTYDTTFAFQKGTLEATKVGAVKATYAGYHTSIIASIIAILIIVLIMVIIYLILRYRRKKKMKKKLQYIKLLEE